MEESERKWKNDYSQQESTCERASHKGISFLQTLGRIREGKGVPFSLCCMYGYIDNIMDL